MKAMPLESFSAVAGVLEVRLNPPHAASQTVRMRVRGGGAWTLQPPIPRSRCCSALHAGGG
jgi:hypothetical protein